MKILDQLDGETFRLIIGGILALGGGAVRVCGNPEHQQWKTIISSLMTAVFAGYLTAVLLHDRISDINYFGAICALGGYSGQLVLVILSKQFENLLRRLKV